MASDLADFARFCAALASHPVPMTLIGFAIILAFMLRTGVVLFGRRFFAPSFLGVPQAIRIVPANDLIALSAA